MLILNFTHPLTDEQLAGVEKIIQEKVSEVRNIPAKFDHQKPFIEQIEGLITECRLTTQEWQSISMLIVPPALNSIAITLLAELHGRMGYFPSCVRLRPVDRVRPPRYEVAEILDLQNIRDEARLRR